LKNKECCYFKASPVNRRVVGSSPTWGAQKTLGEYKLRGFFIFKNVGKNNKKVTKSKNNNGQKTVRP